MKGLQVPIVPVDSLRRNRGRLLRRRYGEEPWRTGVPRLYALSTADGSIKRSVETGSLGWEIRGSAPIVARNGIIVAGNNDGRPVLRDSGRRSGRDDPGRARRESRRSSR